MNEFTASSSTQTHPITVTNSAVHQSRLFVAEVARVWKRELLERTTMRLIAKRVLILGFIAALSATTASAGLIGHWPFEEGSGDTTADLSGSGTTGTIANGATGGPDGGSAWVNDPTRGSVLGFGGGADSAHVRAGSIPVMTLDNDFTWAFWANHHPDNTMPNNIAILVIYNAPRPAITAVHATITNSLSDVR